MGKAKLLRSLGPLIGLLLFSAALWVLYHQLKAYHLNEILRHLEAIAPHRLAAGLGLTVMSYFIMTGYDALALRFIRHPLGYGKIALASFIGYAFSNNIGLSMIAGASVRFRLYTPWGLSPLEIAKLVAFCSLTFWLGFLTLGGVIFLFSPLTIPRAFHIPLATVHPVGLIFLGLVGSYFLFIALRKKPFKFREWEISPPPVGLFVPQVAIAVLDWILAGGVLYVFLSSSSDLSFPGFLGIYMLAQTAGLVSQIPGGLGVFETVVVLLMSPALPANVTLGALLAYRAIYYLLPLGTGAALLGAQEILRKKERFKGHVKALSKSVSGIVPHVLAFTVFVAGAILLLSGATPGENWRLMWLKRFLPLPVLEVSHLLGSVLGAGLLLLARSLQRRIDAAYFLTAAMLCGGIVFSLLKGLDYEEAMVLTIMLGALLPCRRYFYRKASIISQRFTPAWIIAILAVMICAVWLGIFAHKHVEYSGDMWWRFTFSGNAPRFLRSMVGAVTVLFFFALARLLRPAPQRPEPLRQEDFDRASAIVRNSSATYANLALLGDKTFLFSRKNNAFIMYGIEGRSWISLGDPVGPVEEWPELVWRFREICDRYDGWTVFYEVGAEHLSVYLDLGLTLLKFGEEAIVSLEAFSLEGSSRKGLRHTLNKLEKDGCSFAVIPKEDLPAIMGELKVISDAWLMEKTTREKGFSLGFFKEDYLRRFPVAIVRMNGKIVAFANIWVGAEKRELSIDLMRYSPEAPRGVMEYLFIQCMLWGRREGYRGFNLGMAPLSGLEDHELAPLWSRLGAFVFRHGEHFYNFQGLRQYKEKFDPQWEPKYLASPGGFALPRILANLASLISGGLAGLITR